MPRLHGGSGLNALLSQVRDLPRMLETCPADWHPNGFAVFRLPEIDGRQVRVHAWVPAATAPDLGTLRSTRTIGIWLRSSFEARNMMLYGV
jgi:hypothetical protein